MEGINEKFLSFLTWRRSDRFSNNQIILTRVCVRARAYVYVHHAARPHPHTRTSSTHKRRPFCSLHTIRRRCCRITHRRGRGQRAPPKKLSTTTRRDWRRTLRAETATREYGRAEGRERKTKKTRKKKVVTRNSGGGNPPVVGSAYCVCVRVCVCWTTEAVGLVLGVHWRAQFTFSNVFSVAFAFARTFFSRAQQQIVDARISTLVLHFVYTRQRDVVVVLVLLRASPRVPPFSITSRIYVQVFYLFL